MSRMLKPRNATANIAALVGTLLNAGCKLDLGPDIGCVFAFCSGTVIGRVTDAATGRVIRGANVSGPGHSSAVSAPTDANGQYRLDVWAHVDTLYADAADHARHARVVSVPPDRTVTADFGLSPLPPQASSALGGGRGGDRSKGGGVLCPGEHGLSSTSPCLGGRGAPRLPAVPLTPPRSPHYDPHPPGAGVFPPP